MKKLIYALFLVLSAVFLLSGCQKDETITPSEFTVTFNSDGGSEVEAVKIKENQKLVKPIDPTKGEFFFVGWFKEATGVNAWDFDKDVVTKDITLYAKWTTVTFTVTFNSNGGSEVPSATIAKGSTVSMPVPPTKNEAVFEKWFKEAALTNVYDFSTPVNSDITLYAKWITITREGLQSLVNEAQRVKSSECTPKSYEAMKVKLDAALQVLKSDNPTSQQIATAYSELSEALNALIPIPKPAVDLRIGIMIDGIVYVIPGETCNLYVTAISATGGLASDNRITFTYDASKLATWAEDGSIDKDTHSLSFLAKTTLSAGETISITAQSTATPAISKTITLKATTQDEMKAMFINVVNTLPSPDKITYEDYDAIQKALVISYLIREGKQDAAVKAASEKLSACENAYDNLPERIKYSFNGNVCTLKGIIDEYEQEEEEIGEFTFMANGTFPVGTYTQNGWKEGDKANSYYQFRLTFKNDGTVLSEAREAKDANGTSPSEWEEVMVCNYTNQGSQADGGMFFITYDLNESDIHIINQNAKSTRTMQAIFKTGR